MRGVKFLTNEHNKRVAVQIDIEELNKFQGEMEDLLDSIIVESRKNDGEVKWNTVKNRLKKADKIV